MPRSSPRAAAARGLRDVPAEPGNVAGHSILAIFPHPDDESVACGGLLAWCAQLGADLSLLCLTRGEHGQGGGDLGSTRSQELGAAAQTLGINAITLLDHEDGMLPWVDVAKLESDIRTIIDRYRPEVVITFGDDGFYGHPDHVAAYERTTAVVTALGDRAPALYYVTAPPGSMRAIVDHAATVLRQQGDAGTAPPNLILGVADADAFGAAAAPPTLVVDTGQFAVRKLAALACHVTQFHNSALAHVGEVDAARLLGTEHYHRADVGARGDTFIDQLGHCQPVVKVPRCTETPLGPCRARPVQGSTRENPGSM